MTEDDRIAIVGMACRVPGADSPAALWANLLSTVDSIRRYDRAELAAAGVADEPGWVPAFGHLDRLTDFDAALFGYSPDDAARLDPQHRLFLEVAWWALEDAGLDPARREDQIGVYAGAGADRYLRHHLLGHPGLRPPGGLAEDWDDLLAGGTCDYLPTRVAYALGLTGPAVGVQTACSSSLVAVAQAAQGLLDYRCDVAVAGGAAVVSTRQAGYRYRAGGTSADDGVCRPFDADATGQVFGNGAAAVVLRRLDDAVEAGDHVYAVLAGWAVTNDGAQRAGFTTPGLSGQAAVVVEALAATGWDPATIGFVEAHGTGTPVGDAIEVEALGRAWDAVAPQRGPRPGGCALGSVKANLGNLDAAGGVVGLVKAALAVEAGVIPPTPHHRRPHPDVDLAVGPFEVTTDPRPWAGPRRAAVSSFGLGGTNAHVLLESAPDRPGREPDERPRSLVLSTRDAAALAAAAGQLADHLAAHPDLDLRDVAHTLATGRRILGVRAAVTATTVTGAVEALRRLASGDGSPSDEDDHRAWVDAGEAPTTDGRPVSLPGYPFQRDRHWIDPPGTPV